MEGAADSHRRRLLLDCTGRRQLRSLVKLVPCCPSLRICNRKEPQVTWGKADSTFQGTAGGGPRAERQVQQQIEFVDSKLINYIHRYFLRACIYLTSCIVNQGGVVTGSHWLSCLAPSASDICRSSFHFPLSLGSFRGLWPYKEPTDSLGCLTRGSGMKGEWSRLHHLSRELSVAFRVSAAEKCKHLGRRMITPLHPSGWGLRDTQLRDPSTHMMVRRNSQVRTHV